MADAIGSGNLVPRIVAARFIRYLQGMYVYAGRTNRQWEVELDSAGNVVRLNKLDPAEINVGSYAKGTALTYADAEAETPKDLEVDQQTYYSFKVEDIDAVQSRPNIMDEAGRIAADKVAGVIDSYVFRGMRAGATGLPNVSFDYSGGVDKFSPLIRRLFANVNRRMDLAQVPRMGRWAIVPPYVTEMISQALSMVDVNPERQAAQVMQGGYLGELFGLSIYASWAVLGSSAGVRNTHFADTSGDNTTQDTESTVIYGTDYSYAYVEQIAKSEVIRLETAFADAARGLYVYGGAMAEPDSMYRQQINITKLPK